MWVIKSFDYCSEWANAISKSRNFIALSLSDIFLDMYTHTCICIIWSSGMTLDSKSIPGYTLLMWIFVKLRDFQISLKERQLKGQL